jgi:beta-N-acetylhexosaminidase
MTTRILPAFLSVQGTSLSDEEKHLFAAHNPLGVCLFAKGCANVQNKTQLRNLIKQIKEVIGREDVLIAIDQEGGRVRRLLEPEWTAVTAQADIKDLQTARAHAQLIAADLKNTGINVNIAPVIDIEYPQTSTALKSRCFSGDEKTVAKLGQAMVTEYMKSGVCPCIKHMPGHGRGQADPHLELPVINDSLQELMTDFYPFQKLHETPMGMVAHIVLTAVDEKNPATCSERVIKDIIRGTIGFDGLLVSDAIMMNALRGSICERAERCFAAGCDVICLGNADFAANEALCQSHIALTDAAEERLEKVRAVIRRPFPVINTEYVQNKYCAGLKSVISYNYEYDATEVLNRLRKQ